MPRYMLSPLVVAWPGLAWPPPAATEQTPPKATRLLLPLEDPSSTFFAHYNLTPSLPSDLHVYHFYNATAPTTAPTSLSDYTAPSPDKGPYATAISTDREQNARKDKRISSQNLIGSGCLAAASQQHAAAHHPGQTAARTKGTKARNKKKEGSN